MAKVITTSFTTPLEGTGKYYNFQNLFIYPLHLKNSCVYNVKYSKDAAAVSVAHDPELSERGIEESLKTGEAFKEAGINFTRIICSPFIRSIQTAQYILQGMGIEEYPVEIGKALLRIRSYVVRSFRVFSLCWWIVKVYIC